VTISGATAVTATFDLPTFALTVTKAGTGSGTVTSTPAGIACGTNCAASYPSGTAVTMTTTPATGSTFTGWSGGGCTGTGSCTVTLTATTTVISTFGPPPPATISSLTADKNAPQPPGTTVTFSATATGGTPPYQYKWYVGDGTGWSVAQNWSTSSTYAWTPTTANANYRLEVWVRSAGNTVDLPEGFPATSAYRDIFFAISTPPTTVTGLSADRSAPQPPGTTVTF